MVVTTKEKPEAEEESTEPRVHVIMEINAGVIGGIYVRKNQKQALLKALQLAEEAGLKERVGEPPHKWQEDEFYACDGQQEKEVLARFDLPVK